MKFRDKINTSLFYGTEIEFADASISNLIVNFEKMNLPIKFIRDHKLEDIDYKEHYLDMDPTVTTCIGKEMYGGEISSKILHDKKEEWLELKRICEVLKKEGATINSKCSNHITVDASFISDITSFYRTLMKVLIIYEKEIEKFYQGDQQYIRETKNEYASSLNTRLLKRIELLKYNNSRFRTMMNYYIGEIYTSRDGINLFKLDTKNIIEVRYPNGSINETTIQNNINFTMKLFEAIENKYFSDSLLDYHIMEILCDRDSYIRKSMKKNTDDNLFEELIKIISYDDVDYNNFKEQYGKILVKK